MSASFLQAVATLLVEKVRTESTLREVKRVAGNLCDCLAVYGDITSCTEWTDALDALTDPFAPQEQGEP